MDVGKYAKLFVLIKIFQTKIIAGSRAKAQYSEEGNEFSKDSKRSLTDMYSASVFSKIWPSFSNLATGVQHRLF